MESFKFWLAVAGLALASILGACGSVERQQRVEYGYTPQSGVVEGIDYVAHQPARPSGAGAIVGGIAGGVLGHQIGAGVGNTVATIAGAVGGALVGNEVEKRARRDDEDIRVGIRMDDGSYRTLVTPDDPNLRVGDRVTVDGARVYRR
jgi:outer membrane lipoprotein SlyB